MPIIHFHLAEGRYPESAQRRLLVESSQLYAAVLRCPMDRVRAYLQFYPQRSIAVAGELVSEGAADAPYFHFLVLEGRSLAERHALLAGFTDLVVEVLGAERGRVRGGCWPIPPEDWAIGGTPASVARAAEVAARAAVAAGN